MDINTLGIGSLIGSTAVVSMNYYLFHKNYKNEQKKEKLKKLYYPLSAVIAKKSLYLRLLKSRNFDEFITEYYDFFLKLRDIYLDNKVYSSRELKSTFHTLLNWYEIEYNNYVEDNATEVDTLKSIAKFELTLHRDKDGISEFENKLNEVMDVIIKDIEKLS